MDYEIFKQDMEQNVLKNLANRGVPADAGLVEYDGTSSCSIENHIAGKKGC